MRKNNLEEELFHDPVIGDIPISLALEGGRMQTKFLGAALGLFLIYSGITEGWNNTLHTFIQGAYTSNVNY